MLKIHSKSTEFTQNRTEIDKNFQCEMIPSMLDKKSQKIKDT